MIVDDDPIMCEMIKDSLLKKDASLRIDIYGTGEEALGASGMKPDLVILDYSLDSIKADAMNGIQVLAKLKERDSSTAVIFLTSQDKPEVAANTIKFGAYDYILKTETAFLKLEIAVENIKKLRVVHEPSAAQKFINMAFWVLMGLGFSYGIYSMFTGQ